MARLYVSLLGPFQVTLDGQPVMGYRSSKVRALLAYLAVEADRPHRREVLAGLLWPDWPDREALSSLRYALSNLRGAIGDRARAGGRAPAGCRQGSGPRHPADRGALTRRLMPRSGDLPGGLVGCASGLQRTGSAILLPGRSTSWCHPCRMPAALSRCSASTASVPFRWGICMHRCQDRRWSLSPGTHHPCARIYQRPGCAVRYLALLQASLASPPYHRLCPRPASMGAGRNDLGFSPAYRARHPLQPAGSVQSLRHPR